MTENIESEDEDLLCSETLVPQNSSAFFQMRHLSIPVVKSIPVVNSILSNPCNRINPPKSSNRNETPFDILKEGVSSKTNNRPSHDEDPSKTTRLSTKRSANYAMDENVPEKRKAKQSEKIEQDKGVRSNMKETERTDKQNTDNIDNQEQIENDSGEEDLLSPTKADFAKLGATSSCFKCDSIFETRYAIVFTHRFYCCRECLPAETTREMRLGSIIKHCSESVNVRDRRERRLPRNYAQMDSLQEVGGCSTPGCRGEGHINGRYTSHRSVLGCPIAKRLSKSESKTETKKEPDSCPTPGCDGSGHIYPKLYTSHRSLFGCPRKKDRWKDDDGRNSAPSSTNSSPTCQSPSHPSSTHSSSSGNEKKTEKMHCPFPGCNGMGHVTKRYPTHRSLYGCPAAAKLTKEAGENGEGRCPYPACDSSGSTLPDQETHSNLTTCPLMSVDYEPKCTIPGCDGRGHLTGKYSTHRSISSCPLANKLGLLNKTKTPKKEIEIKEEDERASARGAPSPSDSPTFAEEVAAVEFLSALATNNQTGDNNGLSTDEQPIKTPMTSLTSNHDIKKEEDKIEDEKEKEIKYHPETMRLRLEILEKENWLLERTTENYRLQFPAMRDEIRKKEKDLQQLEERAVQLSSMDRDLRNDVIAKREKLERLLHYIEVPYETFGVAKEDLDLFLHQLRSYFSQNNSTALMHRRKFKELMIADRILGINI